MLALKTTAKIRLEIEFEILIGELRILEDDFKRMTLEEFIRVWEPEMTKRKVMLHLVGEEEKDTINAKGKNKRKEKKEISKTDNSEIHNGGIEGST